ncbi:hypothetical protein [Brevibacillus laterosporus]|uniref:hypothetical protein n=1 Tax=Brevibacillus laterosporus TaxID=1465 RepID=UPI000CE49A43|nr:hypothetical protein [Brevibacillus laterosporus]MED1665677.1 hypothetical protein [Brevibacillus laterosporus]MED1667234.1 hypothetical protein [Brevibacillus laterosporus]MED1719698.1 hypothetical protein [Brevibacillus laterosporus]PPA84974.1 hypothetical protein C4A75_09355 [Brevibacillus laterosporus]
MANQNQTFGNFEVKGIITVTPDTFQIDLKGKNTITWNYSRINMKMEDGNGKSFYLNAQDGFDSINGKTIFAQIKDSKEQLQIAFADRNNSEILSHVDESSFIRVALRKVEKSNGKKEWEYNNFLTLYDVINFLKPRLETGMKLSVWGRTKYSPYNDSLNKEFQIQSIYLLPEDDTTTLGFKFYQNVLLTAESLIDDKWEEEGIATLKAKVIQKVKKKLTVLHIPLVIRSTPENKEKVRSVIEKFYKVDGDKVRRIRLEGKYSVGYVSGQVKEEDLPLEVIELINDGIYTKDEVLKMYVNRDYVDEMTVIRPVVNKDRDTNKIKADYSDTEYTLDDMNNLDKEPEPVVITSNEYKDDDFSFLDELE